MVDYIYLAEQQFKKKTLVIKDPIINYLQHGCLNRTVKEPLLQPENRMFKRKYSLKISQIKKLYQQRFSQTQSIQHLLLLKKHFTMHYRGLL